MGNKVMVGNPGLAQPLLDASEIQPGRRDRAGVLHGEITLAGGFVNHGEAARIEHDGRGRAKAFWFGGTRLLPEAQVAKELERRYGGSARKR
jgi:D-alanyl-D-alanine carboxypeptidase